MNLELFFTAQNSGQQTAQAKPGKPGEALGVDGLSGLGFLEFILAQIEAPAANDTKTDTSSDQEEQDSEHILSSDNPLLDKNPSLSLAQILAVNPEVAEQIEEFTHATQLGDDVALTQTLALNQQAFDDILKPLTDGIITLEEIENGSPRLMQALLIEDEKTLDEFLTNFEKSIEQLNALIENSDPALINANFTPEQITALQHLAEATQDAETPEVSAVEVSENNDELAALFSAFVALVPPAPTKPVAKASNETVTANNSTPASEIEQSAMAALAVQLNALTVGGTEAVGSADTVDYDADAEFWQKYDAFTGKDVPKGTDFVKALADVKAANVSSSASQAQTVLPATFTAFESFFSTYEMSPQLLEELGLTPLSTNALHTSALTSLSMQAPQAATPHPATQMIAVNMQKMAGNNQNTQFTIQLDPPDLGRVEVQMNFGKDKTVKTALIVEKPETYLMLQRDAQMLERTLQDLGLESEGFSLELAEQGFDFDRGNERGGGHDKGGTGSGEDAELEVIESTMTWHVDPDTGHMRYNIWA